MFKILVSDALSEEGLKVLQENKNFQVDVKLKQPPEELKKIIGEYDALLVRSSTKVTADIIQHAKKLKIIGRAGVGLDNVDAEAATKQGIIVMNTPGGNTISTAEHTMSLLLSLARSIPQADASLKNGAWERNKFMGVELCGKTLGIVGLGRIGSEVAKRALSFNMKVMAYDPFLTPDRAKELGVEATDLKRLLAESDFITVHTPLTDETKHLIGAEEIGMMKKGVRIINCARGGIVDEKAVMAGMESGKVAGAAFDVYEQEPPEKENPLLKSAKVVTTPHLGASTEEAQLNVAVEIAQQVADALMGRGIRNAVNINYIEFETWKVLKPYITLAEKMGSLQAQLLSDPISEVEINYAGEVIRYGTNPITVAFMKGLLTPAVGSDMVNYVNAGFLAKERGIKVVESKTSKSEEFANLISSKVKTANGASLVCGTLFANSRPRIVKIEQYYVDAIPEGYMIFIYNRDVPGIVGQIGTLLGKNNINIAAMTFGREKPGGNAISVCNVDSEVSKGVLDEIRKSKNIYDAKLIKL